MKNLVFFKSAAEEYRMVFNQHNYNVVFIEPLQFVYVNESALEQKIASGDYDGLIFTSPRAIEAVSQCWKQTYIDTWKNKAVYTVGKTSGDKIKSLFSIEAKGITSGNALNLSEIILKEFHKGGRFLFPCGNLAADTLVNVLQADEAFSVDVITVYETKENDYLQDMLIDLTAKTQSLSGLVFFSPSGCEYVFRQLQTLNSGLTVLPLFAIGNSTANKITNLGLEAAGVALQPNPQSLLQCIVEYFSYLLS